MNKTDELIKRVQNLGARLWFDGNRLELDIPTDFPNTLLEQLRENKGDVLNYLREVTTDGAIVTSGTAKTSVVDQLERMLALGAQMKRGEISAVRCGITGKRCAACQGVPCLGSVPWEE